MPTRYEQMLKVAQQSNGRFWDVRASTDESGKKIGEVYIYGYIVGQKWFDDDVAPMALKQEIDALGDIDTLYVRINSPGGSVWAGNAIYNILKRVDAEVIGTIDGLAASAASVIAMGCDKLIVYKNSMGMIHDAWTVAIGNAKELRKTADVLDKIQNTLVAVYQEKTGLPKDEIVAMIEEEKWMTADDMVTLGFADEIDGSKEVKAAIKGDKLVVNDQEFDASIFGVLPPFEGIAAQEREQERDRSWGTIKRAFGVLASALGLKYDGIEKATVEETQTAPSVLADADQTDPNPATEPQNEGASGDETVPDDQETNEKGSGEDMPNDEKMPQAAQDKSTNVHADLATDIKSMSPEDIEARLKELEQRALAAEEMARAERDKRVESEFIDRVKGYGTLPVDASVFGPVMKRASEALSKEDFDQIESVLKAAGAALEQSDLFRSRGYDGEGDTSAAGQYRAKLKEVKAENPGLSEAEASIEAFNRLPADVQAKVYKLDILPA